MLCPSASEDQRNVDVFTTQANEARTRSREAEGEVTRLEGDSRKFEADLKTAADDAGKKIRDAMIEGGAAVAHEIGHYRLHSQERLFLNAQRAVACGMRTKAWRTREKISMLEGQADKFAACLLMPERFLVPAARSWCFEGPKTRVEAVRSLSQSFDVSREAMKYRLMDLGFIRADKGPVYNLVHGL